MKLATPSMWLDLLVAISVRWPTVRDVMVPVNVQSVLKDSKFQELDALVVLLITVLHATQLESALDVPQALD